MTTSIGAAWWSPDNRRAQGMAAYLAKEHSVARAVLFSSPWDSYGGKGGQLPALAPWFVTSSATPSVALVWRVSRQRKTPRL